MESLKNLKKDIDFMMNEVISDCQLLALIRPASQSAEIMTIIDQTVDLWNQLYERANHPDGKDNRSLVRQHYKAVEKDLLSGAHELFKKISEMAAQDQE